MTAAYFPLCVEPCSNWSMQDISMALYKQQCQLMSIAQKISYERYSRLTPKIMRGELADLQRRIDAARKALGRQS